METKMKQLFRRHGLPTPAFQYVIRHDGRFVARVDAAYPQLRIAIEYDSYEHHTGKLAIVRDNDRRNQLRNIRWDSITFTAADLARDGGIPAGFGGAFFWGIIASMVSGFLAIALLLRYVRTHSFLPFVIYRIVLGVAVIIIFATGIR